MSLKQQTGTDEIHREWWLRPPPVSLVEGTVDTAVALVLPADSKGMPPFAKERGIADPARFVPVKRGCVDGRQEPPKGNCEERDGQSEIDQERAIHGNMTDQRGVNR